MSTRMFNGSTFTHGSAIARMTGMSYTIGGVTVDVTEPEDLVKLFECGQDDLEISIKVKRLPTIARGAANTITITWADGSEDPVGGSLTWICTDTGGGGDENQPIAGTLKFKPTLPAA